MRELVVGNEVHRADQADAGLAHPEFAVGLHHAAGVRAGRNEDVEAVGMLVLDPLEERREVGHLCRRAHPDFVDDLAAGLFEAGLERERRILAGREVGKADRRGLAAEFVAA